MRIEGHREGASVKRDRLVCASDNIGGSCRDQSVTLKCNVAVMKEGEG